VTAARTVVAAAVVGICAGCSPGPLRGPTHAAPMSKPTPIGSEASAGETELARHELEGAWELVALESAPSSGAPRVPIAAAGTLVYDAFGNLTIDAHTTDPAAPVAAREANRLSFRGRAVIDPAKRELKLMDLTGNVDPNEVLSPERRRRFEFEADNLKLSSFDADGQVTAISTWRRRP
jgi:hypothetical protein